jgi:hypothetical protein
MWRRKRDSMYTYRYAVSLRISHPNFAPEYISGKIRIQPSHSWMAGTRRSTPKGEPLKGVNEETYWTSDLHKGKTLQSAKIPLEDFLVQQVRLLQKRKSFLKQIRETGGRTEFFVGLFPTKNMGAELPSSLLARMADLGIDLSLDVYPGKIPHNNAIHRIADKSGSR